MKEINFPNNEYIMEDFKKYLKLKGKKGATVTNKLWSLMSFFKFVKNKKAELLTRSDVEGFILDIKERGLKTSSQNMYIINVKMFIDYLKENNTKFAKKNKGEDFFKNIKLNRKHRDTSEKSYITRADVAAILPHCKSQLDRALIFLLWDSGARVGEILNLNIQDIKLGQMSGTITVDGKTGKRDITITSSIPDLQLWLNQYKGKGVDPLFPSNVNGRLCVRSVENIFAKLVKKANINTEGKKVNVHSIRHGRLTELAKRKVPEMHLRQFAGWTPNSDTPSVYIHPTRKDVKMSILEADGIKPEEAEEVPDIEVSMKPITCPRCQKINSFDAKYCSVCSVILDETLALEMKEAEKRAKEEEQQALIRKLRQEVANEMDRKLKEALNANERKKLANPYNAIHLKFDDGYGTAEGDKKEIR